MSSSIKLKNANGKTVSVTNSNANQTDKEVIYLNTVDELANASGSINAVAIVSDLSRGGTFEWSATGTANGGTVFAGATGYWNRQYSGAVNVKWFGSVGDGINDDSLSFISAWQYVTSYIQSAETANETITKALYLPCGAYKITTNNFLGGLTDTGSSLASLTIFGDGVGQSTIIFKPVGASNYIYNQQDIGTHPMIGLKMQDIEVIFDNSDTPSGNGTIDGFLCKASSGEATQNFQFVNFRAECLPHSTWMILGGTVNEDQNRFINSKFRTLKTLIDTRNAEALNHTLLGVDIDDVYGHIFITKASGQIQWIGGSAQFNEINTNEASIINLGGDTVATGTYSDSTHIIQGIRAEFRGIKSRVLYITENNIPVSLIFDSCTFSKVDFNQNFAKSTISNSSNIVFRSCVLPASSTGSKFEFTNNPNNVTKYSQDGRIKDYLLFENCRSGGIEFTNDFYHSFASITQNDIYCSHVVEHNRCENLPNCVSSYLRYGSGRSFNPSGVITSQFRGIYFPYTDALGIQAGSNNYFNIVLPYGAFVDTINIKRGIINAYSTQDYTLKIVDGIEYLSPGTGTVYGISTTQKHNLSIDWTVSIKKKFRTENVAERTFWLVLNEASSGIIDTAYGSDYGYCSVVTCV